MAEYIERREAVEWFMAFANMGEDSLPAETVISDLKHAIPTADVAPVRRGEWEQFHLGPDDYALRLRCPHCRKVVHERGFHFCPGCGADMRGEK